MRLTRLCLLPAVFGAVLSAPSRAQERYRTPPQVVVDILDAQPLPAVSVSPDNTTLVLAARAAMPTIAELAEPMLGLAGIRLNPATNGPHRGASFTGLRVLRVADGRERVVETPAGVKLGLPQWSPDGRHFVFLVTAPTGIALWAASVDSGRAWAVTEPALNAGLGAPCVWMPSSTELVCRFVPPGRGPAPAATAVPVGPNRQVADGRPAPTRTFQDLLESPRDEALFDHYLTARLGRVDLRTRAVTWLGEPGVFAGVDPSPDGNWLLVQRLTRPYSYRVTSGQFPRIIDVWDATGRPVRRVAELPSGERVPIRGVRAGPRSVQWRAGQPATLVWAEALDGGDPRRTVPHRDRVLAATMPAGEPVELAKTEFRFGGVLWGEGGGLALLTEFDQPTRRSRTWILNADQAGAAPRQLWDRNIEDRYADPGRAMLRQSATGDLVLLQSRDGRALYIQGEGASEAGDRPFVDRLDLATLRTTRLFQSADPYYETVVAALDAERGVFLTSRESRTEVPNYWVREVARRIAPRQLTRFADPAPQLAGVRREQVTYRRADGVQLSGTLYVPPDRREGERLPVVMWVYPAEYATADVAGQVRGSPNRFTRIAGPSHLFLLTQGYAVLDNPSLPVVGGDTANNSYVPQVVSGAQAAIDKMVEMGVGDRARMGVGGHSYGAFTTANLLAHSDLFRAGIARSGAYNRTLTPFGFQAEPRTYWQAPEVYGAMSPFNYADRINEPILLIHGEADDNSGTFPIQSDRLFAALQGLGATAELVTYPYEAHGYASRETILDCIARMIEWMDRYVKSDRGPQRAATP